MGWRCSGAFLYKFRLQSWVWHDVDDCGSPAAALAAGRGSAMVLQNCGAPVQSGLSDERSHAPGQRNGWRMAGRMEKSGGGCSGLMGAFGLSPCWKQCSSSAAVAAPPVFGTPSPLGDPAMVFPSTASPGWQGIVFTS